jgi:hypothetical protein
VSAWLLRPVPASRLAVLRVLVVGYAVGWLVLRLPHLVGVARLQDPARFDPIGILALLRSPVPPAVGLAVLAASLAVGAAALLGWRWRVTGPLFALGFLLVTTYRNSWGQVFHTENLVALHLVILAVAPAAVVLSFDARRAASPASVAGWPLQLMAVATVGAYVVAGWAKLRIGGLDWLDGETLRNQVAHDNVRKALAGEWWSPLARHVVGHAWLWPPLAVATVAVELGAPVALLGGRWRTAWVVAAWTFHVGVLALMAIAFPYQLLAVAYAPFFAVERLLRYRGVRCRPLVARTR